MTLRLFSRENRNTGKLYSLNDEQLVSHYHRTGEMECLGILFERYTHLVFPVCMKYLRDEMEAEDMVMLIFEKLMADLRKEEVRNFKGWLYMVAKNQCLMHLRHKLTIEKSRKEILKDLESELMEIGAEPHLFTMGQDPGAVPMLFAAIERLSEAQRRCIELFYLENHSYKDVCEITGYDMNEVKSHIQNGKRNLKHLLEKHRDR